jgi:hypothetical protein
MNRKLILASDKINDIKNRYTFMTLINAMSDCKDRKVNYKAEWLDEDDPIKKENLYNLYIKSLNEYSEYFLLLRQLKKLYGWGE